MTTTLATLPAVPVLFGGYLLMSLTVLGGTFVLGRDGAHLFLLDGISERLLHQRRYVGSMIRAVAFMVLGVLLAFLLTASIALASAALVLL